MKDVHALQLDLRTIEFAIGTHVVPERAAQPLLFENEAVGRGSSGYDREPPVDAIVRRELLPHDFTEGVVADIREGDDIRAKC